MELLTFDEFGRIQIPEKIREQLGLNGEAQLALEIQDDKLILKPLPQEPEVYYEGRVLVVKAEPIGDTETIVEDLRSQRITDLASW
jgi:AbrB family looped-hinge helix DNA binding protein